VTGTDSGRAVGPAGAAGAGGAPDPAVDPFGAALSAASRLAGLSGWDHHDVAVVLGSGWLPAADRMGEVVAELSMTALGGFTPPSVAGHAGQVRSIAGRSKRILAFLGRVHLYEGHGPARVVHGIRTAIAAGCKTVVLTNAAGAIAEGLQVGQPVLIADHVNLTGQSPLAGAVPPAPYDLRFVDMTSAYSPRLRALAHQADGSLAEGVYACLPGPQYETPAEVRMVRTLGADLVGMSTVMETIAARHLGAEVLGCSLVTNVAAGLGPTVLDHADVLAVGRQSAEHMGDLLADVIARL
jgi:purine-nucleoside phosphorylase